MQRFRASTDVTSKVVDGEAIIINLSDGSYFSLQATGAIVWAMAEAGHDESEIAAELAARFDVDGQEVSADVRRLLAELVAEEIVVADEAAAAGPFSDELATGGQYAPPALEKYTDLSELLALDPPMPGIREEPWQAAADGDS